MGKSPIAGDLWSVIPPNKKTGLIFLVLKVWKDGMAYVMPLHRKFRTRSQMDPTFECKLLGKDCTGYRLVGVVRLCMSVSSRIFGGDSYCFWHLPDNTLSKIKDIIGDYTTMRSDLAYLQLLEASGQHVTDKLIKGAYKNVLALPIGDPKEYRTLTKSLHHLLWDYHREAVKPYGA